MQKFRIIGRERAVLPRQIACSENLCPYSSEAFITALMEKTKNELMRVTDN